MYAGRDEWKSPTAFHFTNFFDSAEQVRFKYSTWVSNNDVVACLCEIHLLLLMLMYTFCDKRS